MKNNFDNKMQNSFDVIWQWFIKIGRKNEVFRRLASERSAELIWIQTAKFRYTNARNVRIVVNLEINV